MHNNNNNNPIYKAP